MTKASPAAPRDVLYSIGSSVTKQICQKYARQFFLGFPFKAVVRVTVVVL